MVDPVNCSCDLIAGPIFEQCAADEEAMQAVEELFAKTTPCY